MDKVLVDTNVLIDYSKGKDASLGRLLEKQKQVKVELFVNPIVVTEFLTDKNCQKPDIMGAVSAYCGSMLRCFGMPYEDYSGEKPNDVEDVKIVANSVMGMTDGSDSEQKRRLWLFEKAFQTELFFNLSV